MNDLLRDLLGRILGRRPPALQVGALCLQAGTGKVLLVTSRGTGRWIIPKGWPMDGRSAGGAALREAWEEAGVRGQVEERPLGRYSYDKKLTRGLSACGLRHQCPDLVLAGRHAHKLAIAAALYDRSIQDVVRFITRMDIQWCKYTTRS